MSLPQHIDADVKCPYYVSDDTVHEVVCEGIIQESYARMRFKNKNNFKKQFTRVCCDHYQECEYRYVLERYKYNQDPNA